MQKSAIDRFLAAVTFTPAVVGYLIDKDKVCLGVRKAVSHGLGENLIAGIGGKVGDAPEIKNETPEQAMDREAFEEIGVKVIARQLMGRVKFIFSHKPSDSSWNQDVMIYTITKWQGTPIETASTQPLWFNIHAIPWSKMWADNQRWLPKVLAGQPVNAVFLFNDDNEIADYRIEKPI